MSAMQASGEVSSWQGKRTGNVDLGISRVVITIAESESIFSMFVQGEKIINQVILLIKHCAHYP